MTKEDYYNKRFEHNPDGYYSQVSGMGWYKYFESLRDAIIDLQDHGRDYELVSRLLVEHWQKNYRRYTSSHAWKEKRKERMELSELSGMCENCSKRLVTTVHHKNYDFVGIERMDDLIAICNSCHQLIHGREIRESRKR